MLVLELSAANRTVERRFLAAFHPHVVLQRGTPLVLSAALKAGPHFLPIGCKREKRIALSYRFNLSRFRGFLLTKKSFFSGKLHVSN